MNEPGPSNGRRGYLRHLRPMALFQGTVFGQLLPEFLVHIWAVPIIEAAAEGGSKLDHSVLWTVALIRTVCNFLGGYLAARSARTQSLLHGLVVGLIGLAVVSVVAGEMFFSYWAIGMSILGAWVYRKSHA
jgi:hypothetical protein